MGSTNISYPIKDLDIIAKMISMVDVEKFKQLMGIGSGAREDKFSPVKPEIIEWYLNEWAMNKYDMFMLFDESLSIEDEINIKLSESDMKANIELLCAKFPQYATAISKITPQEFLGNNYSANTASKSLENYFPDLFVKGCKVSKSFSKLFEDTAFDVELSKSFQNSVVKGKIKVSIDPCDFLMMSTNMHGWQSCMNIKRTDGYNNTLLSRMIDNTNCVAYRENGELYKYSFSGESFMHCSMQMRTMVWIESESSSFCTSATSYPSMPTDVRSAIESLLKKVISGKTKEKGFKIVPTNDQNVKYNKDSGSLSYNDGITNVHTPNSNTSNVVVFTNGARYIKRPSDGARIIRRAGFSCRG
jgi:hypothetical protein